MRPLSASKAGAISSGSPNFECLDFETDRAGRRMSLAQLQDREGITDIGQDRQPAEIWNNLAQEFKPLTSRSFD